MTVCEDGDGDQDHVAVNRDFLLQALAAGARDQLMLEFGAPTAPLAIRRTDTDKPFPYWCQSAWTTNPRRLRRPSPV